MKILAFDTVSNNNDVVILDDGKVVAQNNIKDPSSQAETLVPSIEKCLNDLNIWYQDLDLIAVTKGPGNFTGVRVGFTVAKTIKLTSDIPLITINNLEALAYDYIGNYEGEVVVVLDARLDEFFIQKFEIKGKILKTLSNEPELIKYEEINNFLPQNKFLLVGSGKNIANDLIETNQEYSISKKEDLLKAYNVGLIALNIYRDQGHGSEDEILYVRKPNITKPKK